MRYRLRPGVILTEVCGEHLLVAAREARGKVAYARGLNPGGAYFWSLMAQELDVEEIVARAVRETGSKEPAVRQALTRFAASLTAAGYLLSGEEKT